MCSSDKVQFGVCGGGCVDVCVCVWRGMCVCVRDRLSILKPVLPSSHPLGGGGGAVFLTTLPTRTQKRR